MLFPQLLVTVGKLNLPYNYILLASKILNFHRVFLLLLVVPRWTHGLFVLEDLMTSFFLGPNTFVEHSVLDPVIMTYITGFTGQRCEEFGSKVGYYSESEMGLVGLPIDYPVPSWALFGGSAGPGPVSGPVDLPRWKVCCHIVPLPLNRPPCLPRCTLETLS